MRWLFVIVLTFMSFNAKSQDSCYVLEDKYQVSFDLKLRFCKENSKGIWNEGPDGPFIYFENQKEQYVYLDFFLDSVAGKSFTEYYRSRYYYVEDLEVPDFKSLEYGDSAVFALIEKHRYRRNGKIKSTYHGFNFIVFHKHKVYYFWGHADTAEELKTIFDDFGSRLEFVD